MNKWISVTQGFPQEYTDVLVTDGVEVWPDYFALGEWNTDPDAVITHWMEMPEPPEEDEHVILSISEAKDEETGHVEQYVDIDHFAPEETLVRAFMSVFIAAASNEKLKKCLEKAINEFTDNAGRPGFVVDAEGLEA
jgi:hypothetical protein